MHQLGELPEASSDDLYWTLSLLVTQRKGLVEERIRVKNRPNVRLACAYPDYATFFAEPFGNTALAYWEMHPSPAAIAGICVWKLAEFLQEESHYFFGRKKAAELLAKAMAGASEQEFQAERDQVVRMQVQQFRQLEQTIDQVEKQMSQLIRLTGQRLDTLPGVDTVAAADLLVEIGNVTRFSTPDKLAKYAGIAPNVWSSAGKASGHGRPTGSGCCCPRFTGSPSCMCV